jgi:hypothetical protein
MKPTGQRKVSVALTVIAVGLIVATIFLPDVKVPQEVDRAVAAAPGASGSEIYGFGVPAVKGGTVFNVTLSGFAPRSLEYSLSQIQGDRVLPPLAFGKVGNGPSYSFQTLVNGSDTLELYLIAYNGTAFEVKYNGVWSPFDFLLVYFAPAVFLLMVGLAGVYYFGTRIPKQRNEEAVERELEEARRSQGARIITNQVEGTMVVVHPRP